MKTADVQAMPVPPNLVKSLLGGFDIISNHITLIAFSVSLDLFLWLGPRLSLEQLISDIFTQALAMPEAQTPEMSSLLQNSQAMWQITIWQVTSLMETIGLWVLLVIVGFLMGTLYFTLVSQAVLQGKVDLPLAIRQWPAFARNVILLAIFWLILFLGVGLPLVCMLSFMLISGINIGQLAILIYAVLVVWVFFPLAFSPHGIFTFQSGTWAAVVQSLQMTRATLPTTGLFLLAALVLILGLNSVWRLPEETSWLTIVGVLGHGFITSGILAASFVYYRDTQRFLREKAQASENNLA
ncbi:MAG: hypothetical protein H6Q38_2965 [Chloroflexi bacterium]|nr:hypothetical protein [Chloroflexota bacterium]